MLKSTLRSAAAFAAALATVATGAALATTPAHATATVTTAASTTSTTSTTQAAVSDTLLPGQKLLAGQYIRSKSGVFGLAMTRYGTLGLTQRGVKGLLWQATFRPGVVAVMGSGGSLTIIYGRTQIASIGANSPGAKLVLQNTGNLEILNTRGKAVWNRHMVINTMTQGWQLVPTTALGGNTVLYSTNRVYTLVMRPDGDLVLLQNGKTVLWRTGTAGHPGSIALMQSDGWFFTRDTNGYMVWEFATRRAGAVVQLLDTGRLQLVHGRTVVKVLH
ncbi:hypothetical protein AB0P21_28925 [Kribbella sp. NPDC056861]|uniref:hypothetical protein n=1 Tax=Kribbella sp. NPDC056861 TaxID=3154857 RepID=UPI0034476213